jgi:GNAT superfamily N-acetyltransferase
MSESNFYIRKLSPLDKVQSFKAGSDLFVPLKTFLQKQAKSFQNASIAQTYVAVIDDQTVIGFVTLICSEIDLQDGYDVIDCSQANHYQFLPAVKIARLAVDSRYRGLGVGSILVDYAIALIIDQIAENVGCRFVVTDAKSEAVDFYQKQGFVLLDSADNHQNQYSLMFLDLLSLKG